MNSVRKNETLGSSASWPDTRSQRSRFAAMAVLPQRGPGALSFGALSAGQEPCPSGCPIGRLPEPASRSGRGSLAGFLAETRLL